MNRWTRKAPTVPEFYWTKYKGPKPMCSHWREAELVAMRHMDEAKHIQWFGPVFEPKPNKKKGKR